MIKLEPVQKRRLTKIVSGLQSGDKVALAIAYQLYHKPLTRFLQKKFGLGYDAEDLASDVILLLPEIINQFTFEAAPKSKDPLFTWLLTIAQNKAIDFLRKRHKLLPLDEAINIPTGETIDEKVVDLDEVRACERVMKVLKESIKSLSEKEKALILILNVPYLSKEQQAE